MPLFMPSLPPRRLLTGRQPWTGEVEGPPASTSFPAALVLPRLLASSLGPQLPPSTDGSASDPRTSPARTPSPPPWSSATGSSSATGRSGMRPPRMSATFWSNCHLVLCGASGSTITSRSSSLWCRGSGGGEEVGLSHGLVQQVQR